MILGWAFSIKASELQKSMTQSVLYWFVSTLKILADLFQSLMYVGVLTKDQTD